MGKSDRANVTLTNSVKLATNEHVFASAPPIVYLRVQRPQEAFYLYQTLPILSYIVRRTCCGPSNAVSNLLSQYSS